MQKISKKLEYINTDLINLVIFLIGLILTLIGAFIIKDVRVSVSSNISSGVGSNIGSNAKTILVSIGCSLIASSVVAFLSSKYLYRRSKIKDIIDIWGLEGIFRTRQEMNISSNEHMQGLKEQLDIMAFGLGSLRDAQGDEIERKVKKGLKIRILTLDPKSKFLEQREKDEKKSIGSIKKSIENLTEWIDELKKIATDEKNIEIEFYDTLPLDFYFREDNALFIGPYLYGKGSQQTISYEFKNNSKGFSYYTNYFEKLWSDKDFSKSLVKE